VHELSPTIYFLQTEAQIPVNVATRCIFVPRFACIASRARYNHPLVRRWRRARLSTPLQIIHFEHTINGRPYVIEVSAVGQDRWRAQIARRPGGSRALMPFYGATPQEAAAQLSGWLTRASLGAAK
jgi:hypothetical protein